MSIVCLFLIWNMWKLQGSSCAHADLEGQNREIFHPSTLREPLIGESCGKASPLTERVGEGFAPMKTYRCTCHLSFNPASKGCLRFDYLKETTTLNLETNSKQCWEHLVSTVTMVFIDIYIYYTSAYIMYIYIYILYKHGWGLSHHAFCSTPGSKYIKVHNPWCHQHAIRFDPEAVWKLRNPSRFVPRS